MQNNNVMHKFFIICILSLLGASFLYGFYIFFAPEKKTKPEAVKTNNTGHALVKASVSNDSLWHSHKDESSSSRLVLRPEFGKLPGELFPGKKSFSLNFHQLSKEMLTPQSAENTRAAKHRIRLLQEAVIRAEKATKQLHSPSHKAVTQDNKK